MALKKTVSTNFGINAEYEDVYKLEVRNCNGTKTFAVNLHGWQKKHFAVQVIRIYGARNIL